MELHEFKGCAQASGHIVTLKQHELVFSKKSPHTHEVIFFLPRIQRG